MLCKNRFCRNFQHRSNQGPNKTYLGGDTDLESDAEDLEGDLDEVRCLALGKALQNLFSYKFDNMERKNICVNIKKLAILDKSRKKNQLPQSSQD